MSILDHYKRVAGVVQAGETAIPIGFSDASTKAMLENVPYWLQETGRAEQFTVPELSLAKAQEELFLRLSWVAIAVGHKAAQAAGTDFSVKRLEAEETFEITNHPLELRMMRPNPLQSRFEFLEATFAFRALTGNAYWWLNRMGPDDQPEEIFVIPSHKIRPVPDGNMFLRGYVYDPGDGREILLETWEIVHFKRFHPLNSYVGLSPIEALATVAVGDLKMQEWNKNFFAENNAKMPGLLAFSDPIGQSDWAKLKNQVKEEHGGTKRNLMMLQNVGKGGVEWVATAMSQKDMEFLAGRKLNKEEIYEMYAPGLTSMLSQNSTEANSKVGKTAFMELAVWPDHVAVAEKITNDLLPVYGDNLVGKFADVRPTDRMLSLKEQEAYERTHTIDESRKKYYREEPLPDGRGEILISEIHHTGGSGMVSKEEIEESEAQFSGGGTLTSSLEAKAKERDQFRRFAQRRIDEDKKAKISDFVFKHLSAGEQMALKAEYLADSGEPFDEAQGKRLAVSELTEKLEQAVVALRETA